MKILHSTAFLSSSVALFLPMMSTEAYNVGGSNRRCSNRSPSCFNVDDENLDAYYFPRMMMSPVQRRRQAETVNRAFEKLARDLNQQFDQQVGSEQERSSKKEASRMPDKESIRRQKEWVNKAFGLASEFSGGTNTEKVLKTQQEWINGAFDLAMDAVDGSSYSPLSSIEDTKEYFKVTLDIPGVEKQNVSIQIEEKGVSSEHRMLIISGFRKVRREGETGSPTNTEAADNMDSDLSLQFNRSFALPSTVDEDGLSAELENGVLTITALKKTVEPEKPATKSIPIN